MDDKTPPPAPDYTALAQRYLELWQEQVARLAKDPPKEMGDLSAAWSKMATTMASGMTPGMAPGMAQDKGAAGHDPNPDRAASAAPAYGDGGVDRAGGHGGPDAAAADRRLAAIEQRLAVLESQLAAFAARHGADSKPAKPRAAGGGRGARKKS